MCLSVITAVSQEIRESIKRWKRYQTLVSGLLLCTPVHVESGSVREHGHYVVGKAVPAMTMMDTFLLGTHNTTQLRKMNWPVCWPSLGKTLLAFGKQLVNGLSTLSPPSQTSL